MISRVCYCFRLSRVSYSLYCNKLSVHNIPHFILLDSLFVSLYYFFYPNSPFVLVANEITPAVCFTCLMVVSNIQE